MSRQDHRHYVYRLDAQDRLCFLSREWMAFACENDARVLTREPILGQSVWAFIADKETRHLYELIFHRVRSTNSGVSVPFRCDSPAVRRYMELHISALPGSGLELVGHLLREEPREDITLLEDSGKRDDRWVVICSWCKRLLVSEAWLEVEDAVVRLKLFYPAELPELTHGVCGDCQRMVMKELEGYNLT